MQPSLTFLGTLRTLQTCCIKQQSNVNLWNNYQEVSVFSSDTQVNNQLFHLAMSITAAVNSLTNSKQVLYCNWCREKNLEKSYCKVMKIVAKVCKVKGFSTGK